MLTIRSMQVKDAIEVAELQVKCWQRAYAGILPADYLSALDSAKKAENWKQGLEINPDLLRMVARKDKKLLGYVVGAENRSPDKYPSISGELYALYVDPEAWQQKIGLNLILTFKQQMKSLGYDSILIWVLRDNQRARAFYQAIGATLIEGEKQSRFGEEVSIEVPYQLFCD